MIKQYVMAFDEGTTGCRSILFGHDGNIEHVAYREFSQIYPEPGWVEHDPMEIWKAQLETAHDVIVNANARPENIVSIGITNQRETTVVWDKNTGLPVMNAIVWQDRRTSSICDDLVKKGLSEYIKENTGLIIDAYFSGTKVKWILDNVPGAREKAEAGQLLFGTIDSWLIWKLSGGKVHVTDYSNASRTMLFNIKELQWDKKILSELDIPECILPTVKPSSEVYGMTDKDLFEGIEIPIASAIGDQQGALFGQACFKKGMVKATYGTGGSLMMNTGKTPYKSDTGLLTTVAWGINGEVNYALEGLIYVMGASVQWLRDELCIIDKAEDTEYYAKQVPDTNNVYVIPAFTGLSAPYWDQYARGAVIGLTRGANKKHIIRATLESMAYQIKDVIVCMEKDSGIVNKELKVDGGACKNNFLMQFQSDILNVPVYRPKVVETTARGAAFSAGLAVGFWGNKEELTDTFSLDASYNPSYDEEKIEKLNTGWKKAVKRVLN